MIGWAQNERRGALLESDKHKIFESDAFLFVPDEGACVELGLASMPTRSSAVRRSFLQGPRRGGARPLLVPLLREQALRVRAPAGREAFRSL
jgi:hypothetical protein